MLINTPAWARGERTSLILAKKSGHARLSALDPSFEDRTGDCPLEHCFLLYTTFFCMLLFALETRVDCCTCANSNC